MGRSRRGAPVLVAFGAAAALLLGACGGGEDATSSEGEAIVDRVKAAYADVPAVVVETSGHLEDGTPVEGRQVILLEDGVAGAGTALITGPSGGGAEIVWDADGTTFTRLVGADCWMEDESYGAAGNEVFDPRLEPGSQPRRAGGRIFVVGTENAGSPVWEWEIDASTYRLVRQRLASPTDPLAAEEGRFRVPRRTPVLPAPTPVC